MTVGIIGKSEVFANNALKRMEETKIHAYILLEW